MAHILELKNRIFPSLFFAILLFSCEMDDEVFSASVIKERDIAVLDDNFRIPSHQVSILDVLSNDIYRNSGNTRIVGISKPSNGTVRINANNTITYIPESVRVYEIIADPKKGENTSMAGNADESNMDITDTLETTTEEVPSTTDQNASLNQDGTRPAESQSEEMDTQEVGVTTNTQETVTAPVITQDIASENQNTLTQETAPLPTSPEIDIMKDETTEVITPEETVIKETSSENVDSYEIGHLENEETDDGDVIIQDDNSGSAEDSTADSADDSNSEIDHEDSSATSTETKSDNNTAENVSEEVIVEEIQEDTFTYTTETENEDGSVTTETATVTVEVESNSVAIPQVTAETETRLETDYWRDPVIAGSHIMDERFYDLDTDKIYSREVSLRRGQVENYIEHENCPQRIKDKWDDRIEVTPADVNGSQNGLQEIFDAHPRGTLFYLRAGVYQDQRNAVLDNDQDVVGEYGAILDGSGIRGDSEESTRAIRSMERGFICNLKVREYPTWNDPQNPKNPRGAALEVIQRGAILNCDIHSHNKAIAVIYGSKAMWNKVTAGRLGMYGYGSHDPNSPNRKGTVVKYNEMYDCNFNGYDGEHEAGGAKFVQIDGVIWSHNYIHDIPSGGGIWQDGENRNSDIYNNVIIKTHRGIFSEISHTSNIHHNTVEYGTGFGAIYMSNSDNEKVHHNFIRWCRNGISVRDKERGTSTIYPGQAYRGMNNEVYENYIWQRPDPSTWTHGVAALFDGHIDPNNTSNRWRDNHYYVDDNAEGAALFSENEPYTQMFMYSRLAAESDHRTISWDQWRNLSGDTNATLEFERFF